MREVDIEIQGLDLRGSTAPRRGADDGQRFVFDLELVVHDAGVRTDELADTVDYTQVVDAPRRRDSRATT